MLRDMKPHKNWLKQTRLLAEASQQLLSFSSGVPQPIISEIERGVRLPTEAEKKSIAAALCCDPEAIFNQGEEDHAV